MEYEYGGSETSKHHSDWPSKSGLKIDQTIQNN